MKKLTIIKKATGKSSIKKLSEYIYYHIIIDKNGNRYCLSGDTLK